MLVRGCGHCVKAQVFYCFLNMPGCLDVQDIRASTTSSGLVLTIAIIVILLVFNGRNTVHTQALFFHST
jgi:hypothetical protein